MLWRRVPRTRFSSEQTDRDGKDETARSAAQPHLASRAAFWPCVHRRAARSRATRKAHYLSRRSGKKKRFKVWNVPWLLRRHVRSGFSEAHWLPHSNLRSHARAVLGQGLRVLARLRERTLETTTSSLYPTPRPVGLREVAQPPAAHRARLLRHTLPATDPAAPTAARRALATRATRARQAATSSRRGRERGALELRRGEFSLFRWIVIYREAPGRNPGSSPFSPWAASIR